MTHWLEHLDRPVRAIGEKQLLWVAVGSGWLEVGELWAVARRWKVRRMLVCFVDDSRWM